MQDSQQPESQATAAADTSQPMEKQPFDSLPGIPLEEVTDLFPEADSVMDERIARLHQMKRQLGSPAGSVGDSVASGQFDDVSSTDGGHHQSRSRTISSSSEHEPIMSPIHEVVIPLPDGSDLMQAKYASLDNLRNSPIALPDSAGCFSPNIEASASPAATIGNPEFRPRVFNDTGAHSYFSSRIGEPPSGETTPVAGTSGFTPITEQEPCRTTTTGPFSHYMKGADCMDTTSSTTAADLGAGRAGNRAYTVPAPKEPYTPGSYLANRDKYKAQYSGDSSVKDIPTASESPKGSPLLMSKPAETYIDELGVVRTVIPVFPDVVYIIDDLPGIHATVKVQSGVIEHTFKEQDLRDKRETASNTYASSGDLTESLVREKKTEARDSRSRDSLVHEVLERETRAKDKKTKPQSAQEWLAANEVIQPIPADVVLDKGRLSAIRESLSNELATGYSLKDYKNYVAKNYGHDEASRIRDRTPQRFASYDTQTQSGLGHQEGPSYQPYYVLEDTQSMSSEKDYAGRRGDSDTSYSGRRAASCASDTSYEDVTSRGFGSYGLSDLGSERLYDRPRRSEGLASDRTYGSTPYSTTNTQRPSGYSSEASSSSSSEHAYSARPFQHKCNLGEPQKQQYKRSDSTDSQQSTSSSYRRERQADTWDQPGEAPRRRSLFGDRPSLFEHNDIMALLEDLIYDDKHDKKHDKFGLWERHSSLLRDDNFCRDFFTKDWGISHFDDDHDDFFKNFGCRRTSKTTRTEEQEVRQEGNGSGHMQRTKRTESVESDNRSKPKAKSAAASAEGHQSSSASSQGQSGTQHKQHPASQSQTREPMSGRSFNDAGFREGNFGDYAEGGLLKEESQYERRSEGRGSDAQGREGRGNDALFFTDFDDLISRFNDLKMKASLDSPDERHQKKGQEPTR